MKYQQNKRANKSLESEEVVYLSQGYWNEETQEMEEYVVPVEKSVLDEMERQLQQQQKNEEKQSSESDDVVYLSQGYWNEETQEMEEYDVPVEKSVLDEMERQLQQQQKKEEIQSMENDEPMIEMGAFNEKGELVDTIRVPAQPAQPESPKNWQEMHRHQQNKEDNHSGENEELMIEMGAFNEKGELVDVIRVPAQPD